MSLAVVQLPRQRPTPEPNLGEGLMSRMTEATRRRDAAEHVAYLSLIAMWSLYVMPARGGWEINVVPAACSVAFLALLVLRPWKYCSGWLAVVACAPAAGSLLVAALSPFGDGGPVSVSRWGYFGILLLATASYARTSARRAMVLCALLLAGLHQYVQAWVPWWGGDDGVLRVMTGTLYSANPFGGLMLTFALLAASAAVLGSGRLRQLAWCVAPLCASGVFLSAARAAVGLLVVGGVLLGLVAFRVAGLRGLLRVVLLAALSWGFLALTTSSLLFEGGRGALAGVSSKEDAGQTLDSTSGIRLDFWSAAWGEFRDDPVVGGGIGSYAPDSRARMAPGAQRSPFAHNEVLGSLAEGGLVLGIPVLISLIAVSLLLGRTLLSGATRVRDRLDPAQVAAALGGGALLAHAMVDFPLSFPALLGLLGVLTGCCVRVTRPAEPSRHRIAAAALVGGALLVCGVYVGLSHDQAGVGGRAGLQAVSADGRLLAEPFPGIRDARLQVARATRLAGADDRSPAELAAARQALEPLLPFDLALGRVTVDLLVAEGRGDEAAEVAERLALEGRHQAPILLSPYAERLLAAGRRQEAFDLLAHEVFTRAEEGGRLPLQLLAVLDRAYGLAGAVEPGWSCARDRMLASGALTPEHPLAQLPGAGSSAAACSAWSEVAADILGDRL